MHRACFLFLFFLLFGCVNYRLCVQTEYITPDKLASYAVNTPDPNQCCPTLGQQLIISWTLNKKQSACQELLLHAKIRFRNHEEKELCLPITKPRGVYTYSIVNEEFFRTHGIATYQVEIWGNGQLLEQWTHQTWTELIKF